MFSLLARNRYDFECALEPKSKKRPKFRSTSLKALEPKPQPQQRAPATSQPSSISLFGGQFELGGHQEQIHQQRAEDEMGFGELNNQESSLEDTQKAPHPRADFKCMRRKNANINSQGRADALPVQHSPSQHSQHSQHQYSQPQEYPFPKGNIDPYGTPPTQDDMPPPACQPHFLQPGLSTMLGKGAKPLVKKAVLRELGNGKQQLRARQEANGAKRKRGSQEKEGPESNSGIGRYLEREDGAGATAGGAGAKHLRRGTKTGLASRNGGHAGADAAAMYEQYQPTSQYSGSQLSNGALAQKQQPMFGSPSQQSHAQSGCKNRSIGVSAKSAGKKAKNCSLDNALSSESPRRARATDEGNKSLAEQPLGNVFAGLGGLLGTHPACSGASSSQSSVPPPLAFNAGATGTTMLDFERRCNECTNLAFSLVWRDTSSTYLAQRKKKGGEKSNARTERSRKLQVAFAAMYLVEAVGERGKGKGKGKGGGSTGGSSCSFFLLPLAPCTGGGDSGDGDNLRLLPVPCETSSEQRWQLLMRVLGRQNHPHPHPQHQHQHQHQQQDADKVCFDAQLALVSLYEWQKQHQQQQRLILQQGGHQANRAVLDMCEVRVLDPKVAAYVLDTSDKAADDKLAFECLIDKYLPTAQRQQTMTQNMIQPQTQTQTQTQTQPRRMSQCMSQCTQSQHSHQNQRQSQFEPLMSPSASLAASSSAFSSMAELLKGLRTNLHLTLQLHIALSRKLNDVGAQWSYRELETPLVPLLARMEVVGIRFDEPEGGLLRRVQEQIDRICFFAHKVAGREFNLASPEQVRSSASAIYRVA
jgi:hypothetical protein